MRKIFLLILGSVVAMQALSLDEAKEQLKHNNLNIKLSKTKIELSKSKREQKKQQSFGQINGFGSYTQYNNPRTLAPLTPPINPDVTTSDTLTTVGVGYSVTLFNGFRDTSEEKLATITQSLEENLAELTSAQITYTVESLYCDILTMQHSLKANQSYHEVLIRLQETIELEKALGKKSLLDVLRVSSEVQNNISQEIQIKTKIDILKNSLSLLLYGAITPLSELEELEVLSLEIKDNFDMHESLSLQIANKDLQKSEQNYIGAKSNFYPKIYLNAAYSNTFAKGTDEDVSYLALNFNWTLYDFGISQESVAQAKIATLQAKINLEKTKQELQLKIEEASHLITQNQQLLYAASTYHQLLQKTQEIEKLRWKEGQSDINDYLLALSLAQKSFADTIAARYTLIKSQYYLEYVTQGYEK